MEMCRACLATGKDMVPMNVAFVINYNLLTNLSITLSEEMPLYTCNSCVDAFNFCIKFREKCIASYLTLKEMLLPENSVKSENENNDGLHIIIKEEFKLEYESDSNILEGNNLQDPIDTYDDSTYLITTECDEDWAPNKKVKPLKKKIKKEPKVKKSGIKVKIKGNKNYCDDALEHCGICSKSFDNKDELGKHIEFHKLDESCELCSERFIDFTHLLSHRIVHLPENQKKCHICSQRFVLTDHLEFHYAKKHNFREGGQLICKLCLTQYVSPKKLVKHIWAVHSPIKFTCDDCGKGFRVKHALRSHMYIHNNVRNCKCDLCDFTCKYPSGIKDHKLRKHTEGRVYCKICGRPFASQEKLDEHRCKHALGVCPICGLHVPKSWRGMSRHLETHSNVYKYKCDRCTAKFKSAASFKAHQNKHDGNKTFHCEYCPQSFYFQPVLIKHRRTHTGEKPYVCKICEKAFTGNHNLKVHMKVHGQNLIVKKNAQPSIDIFK